MKHVCICALLVAIALAGCATATIKIAPAQYSGYDCARIAGEQRRMYTRADELASLGSTTAREAEYARLREEHDALREAAIMKECGSGPRAPVEEANRDTPAAQGDTGPRIAPPEVPPSEGGQNGSRGARSLKATGVQQERRS